MVKVIQIRTSGDFIKASNSLKRMSDRLPEMTREAMREWGNVLERDMREATMLAGIEPFTGGLQHQGGINYRQGKKSDKGYLFMRQYGIFLDEMRPHWVNVTRRRTRLLAWALGASNVKIRERANLVASRKISKFSIKVKPHPFIRMGWNRARPKLNPILAKHTKRAIEGA